MITEIISIIAIIIIGLIVAPMLTLAETRKFKALFYFMKIPKEKLGEMIENCEYCLQLNDEKRYLNVILDYEKALGLKLISKNTRNLMRH